MKERLLICGMLTLLLLCGLSGCVGPNATEYFDGEYPVHPSTILSVSNINGPVDIIGWAGDTVRVNATKTSSSGTGDLENVNISVSQTENHIEIVTRHTSQLYIQTQVDYLIMVPYNLTVETITTTNGAITISNASGDILASASNGAICITDVEGMVSATTSNGHIEILRTTGIGSVHSSNAAITAEVNSFQDNISIETSNGAVTVYMNPFLNAAVEMTTSNADVQLHGILLNETLSEETHVIGTLGTNGKRIDIHTSNAHIYLHALQP